MNTQEHNASDRRINLPPQLGMNPPSQGRGQTLLRLLILLLLLGFLSGLGSLIFNSRQESKKRELKADVHSLAPKAEVNAQSFDHEADLDEYIPSIYPSFGRISDHYGTRIHPISGKRTFHQGLDIANHAGTPVYATAAGVISKIDYHPEYGKRIYIDHGNGFCTLYAHLYSAQVRSGEKVCKGEIIALMGNTGMSTGSHLHYEVHYESGRLNPALYLQQRNYYATR